MESNNWIKYKIEIRERLRKFALSILLLSERIPAVTSGKVINYQLAKSGTSVYANYRAALRGRSKAEFFSKISIAVEEADEAEMWLELLIASKLLNNELIEELHIESLEIVKTLSSMRKKISP
ncbi:MAG TPA: four helix bundle protein [Candidatus Babeliaceae bacterium]|nr:four helix bundle protein [Candidatus Babeliaceae bacterium]